MGNSFLLIIAGLLIFYLVISDKWKCVEGFAACVGGKSANNNTNVNLPNLPTLPNTQSQPIGAPLGFPNLSLNTNWGANGF